MNKIETVSIAIGNKMYNRFRDLPGTPSQIIAEFVDNAIQSAVDNKDVLLLVEDNYKLKVSIDFDKNEEGEYNKLYICDNAAGINANKFITAFQPAVTPEDNSGLNEFGMGLKTAAYWLGSKWSVETTALKETEKRIVNFDLNEISENDLQELPVITEMCSNKEHYTRVTITCPTENFPKREKSIETIARDLASTYRNLLRNNELELWVNGELLTYEEYEPLVAPYVKGDKTKPIIWKKEIFVSIGRYKAKGFIGILKKIDNTKNGLVLLRRNRVIIGANTEARYFPKIICGSAGNFRYRRIYGEFELEGFEVSFNKNDVRDKENLELLMEVIKEELTKDINFLIQADEYRLDEQLKTANKLVNNYNKKASQKKYKSKPEIDTVKYSDASSTSTVSIVAKEESPIMNQYSQSIRINSIDYDLNIQFVEDDENSELFWTDVTKKEEHIIICKINTSHLFFKEFGNPDDSLVAILKSLSVAQFASMERGTNDIDSLFDIFNESIKKIKI